MSKKKKQNKNSDDFEKDIILDKEKYQRLREEGEERDENIEESLSEIYRNEKGEMIDVDHLNIKKKRGVIFWFLNFLFVGLILIVLSLGAYYYIYNSGTDSTAVDLIIESKEKVNANEEFVYKLKYRNLSSVALTNVRVNVNYPEDFVFQEADPAPTEDKNVWNLGRISPRDWGEINIKGKMIGKQRSSGMLFAEMDYTPENFSSEFKKEASFSTSIKGVGFSADFNYPTSVLVGEENEILITLDSHEDNFFDRFEMEFEKDPNVRILGLEKEDGSEISLEETPDASWIISNFGQEEELTLKYKVVEKKTDNENMNFKFSYTGEDGEKIIFFEKSLEFEAMKSDLNLTLIVNGSQKNEPVDFGQTLNYSIVYSNRGEAAMGDVVIMAVLESDFLDWTTLENPDKGRERGNTITWTKDEIPSLEKIEIGDEGAIDFSIDVASFRESDLGGAFEIKSFAQYDIGSLERPGDISTSTEEIEDDKSNTIINEINSDLSLDEEVRYFNEDNMPVGTGPLPPQVGEETTFKVYWTLNNNLHELNDLQVEMELPDYVEWDEKNRTSVGSVAYNKADHKVVWQIGRLPITVYRADAEFSISISPEEGDKNKVIVLTDGSVVSAKDVDTGARIEEETIPKTTKLEDDDIASMSSDGRVR